MTPHRSFKLHKLPRSLEHPYGVYRLSHANTLFRVSLTDSGRHRWGDVMRIGYSRRLLDRLGDEYGAFRTKNAALDEFLRQHYGSIDVEVEFLPKRRLDDQDHLKALKLRESVLIGEHAKKKKRIPRFNDRGEFIHACEHLGSCYTKAEQKELLRPWVEDEIVLETPATAASLTRLNRTMGRQ